MQLFINDLSNDEISVLLIDCDEEMRSLKNKLVSIKLEKDIIQRKMKLIKKEKEILQLVQSEKSNSNKSPFEKFLSTENLEKNPDLSQSLNLRYTNSLRRYGEDSLNNTVIKKNNEEINKTFFID